MSPSLSSHWPWHLHFRCLQGIPTKGSGSTTAWPSSSFLFSTNPLRPPAPPPSPGLANTGCVAARCKLGLILGTGEKVSTALCENQIPGKIGTVKWGRDWVFGLKTLKFSEQATRTVEPKQKPHIKKWRSRWDNGKKRLSWRHTRWANLIVVVVCKHHT